MCIQINLVAYHNFLSDVYGRNEGDGKDGGEDGGAEDHGREGVDDSS